jgi:hypothetical protein
MFHEIRTFMRNHSLLKATTTFVEIFLILIHQKLSFVLFFVYLMGM